MASDHRLDEFLKNLPSYRTRQIHTAWFDTTLSSYDQITTLPLEMRTALAEIPWLSVAVHTFLKSELDNTRKALLKLADEQYVELVIMGRPTKKQADPSLSRVGESDQLAPDRYTICVSCQAGCPMKCAFCATGKQGFKRNLSVQEIVDQYRLSQRLLAQDNARVANIVFMGQGEPLLNYENVKNAVNILLKNTDLGPTKITISTAGVVPSMEKILQDPDFPAVRWAISLHSAIEESRKFIMPSHRPGFLEFLVKWANEYHEKFGTKTHFVGLEYIMLGGVNDDDKHLKALIDLGKRMPYIRINLIPYNSITDAEVNNIDVFSRTPSERIEHWRDTLMNKGFTVTVRYSQGQDIAAACGQLRNKTAV
jgi:23S rRNA (adenine2503-C2)-methyltransferase